MSVRSDLTECNGGLADNEIHVWHAELEVGPKQLESLYGLLDRQEQDRALQFKVRVPRDEFVVSHAFVRLALGKYLHVDPRDVQFRVSSNGKPELIGNGPLRFNLSHTHNAAVLAITRNRPVGVDVERIREDLDCMKLAERFFSTKEVNWLRSQPRTEMAKSFYGCWTAKEAYMKATGTGLSAPLAGFSVIPTNYEDLRLEISDRPDHSKTWSMWQLDVGENLRCALAVQEAGTDLHVRTGKWRWRESATI